MDKATSMLDFLSEILVATIDRLPRVVFNKNDERQRTLIALYATIIEQADSAVTLRRDNRWTGVNHILRSSMEAYTDLINLANDSTYLNQLNAKYHSEWIKLISEGVKGDNIFLTFFKDNAEAKAQLAYHQGELAAIETHTKVMSVFDRFRKAGLEREYRSMYNSLCNDTHNNIRALTDRHFRLDKDGLQEMVIFEDVDITSVAASLDSFMAILNGSNKIIHHYFNTDVQAEVEIFHTRRVAKGLYWENE
ncbi:DUF5677 domain-containing protein [Rhizobium sp. BR 314]|uniref:DUF5677 domain-containing protein n=1 Tax=Rhizobium sp. BR 314 TaxID=3040013 RepID=UPI0039BFC4C9